MGLHWSRCHTVPVAEKEEKGGNGSHQSVEGSVEVKGGMEGSNSLQDVSLTGDTDDRWSRGPVSGNIITFSSVQLQSHSAEW